MSETSTVQTIQGPTDIKVDKTPAPAEELIVPDETIEKVIVTVHGVGDQFNFATLQSVVNQFCKYVDCPPALPLGSFNTGQSYRSVYEFYPKEPRLRPLAFAEVYWARVPRAIVSEGYRLEEAKRWGRTLVERARMEWKKQDRPAVCVESDFNRTKLVLTEIIHTVAVLERLCYIADRAGLFTFDLRKLLADYVGDVQIVADFHAPRVEILDMFYKLMSQVAVKYPKAELYVMAHSEGSVIAFLGLLNGAHEKLPWFPRVKGFMTFGSPIDIHLLLWSSIFPQKLPKRNPAQAPIAWRNYTDRADPIGFGLEATREWLAARKCDLFEFEAEHDMAFSRYPFPGKAHIDYWNDEAVFGHFIENVVKVPAALPAAGRAPPTPRFPKPPRDIKRKKWASFVAPYFGVVVMLFIGVYVVCKALLGAIDPHGATRLTLGPLMWSVFSSAILILGITLSTRVVRLTSARRWHWGAVGFLLFTVALYYLIWRWIGPNAVMLGDWPFLQYPAEWYPVEVLWSSLGGLVLLLLSFQKPRLGALPMIALGTAAVAYLVGHRIGHAHFAGGDVGRIWPVVLAMAGFAYLWWLSALVFDLVFVWHTHIREAKAIRRLKQLIQVTWESASTP